MQKVLRFYKDEDFFAGEKIKTKTMFTLKWHLGVCLSFKRDKHTTFNKKRYKISSTQIIKHIKIHNKTVSKTPKTIDGKMFNLRNHPAILAHFPIFDRFQKSKKNSQTQTRMAAFLKIQY